jgi:cyclopropane fatty-acyl-phospholipid synthase-like methyltransferase
VIERGSVDWTPEIVERFWRARAARGVKHFCEFNRQGIIRVLRLSGGLGRRVLDWGCGDGALLEGLIDAKVEGWGVDASPRAVELTRSRLHGRPGFGGVSLLAETGASFEDGFFDSVTCIETIEHVDSLHLSEMLASIRGLLADGGTFLVSTPCQEDLESAAVHCPFCDSLFHPVQHIRSWSPAAVARVLEEAGFAVVFCQGIRFEAFQAWSAFEGSSTEVLGVLKSNLVGRLDPLLRASDALFRRKFPRTLEFRVRCVPGRHLCAVARKRR